MKLRVLYPHNVYDDGDRVYRRMRRGDVIDESEALDGRPALYAPHVAAGDDTAAGDREQLEQLAVADLQALARDRGVAGRSSMTKAQLVDAIAGGDDG